MYTEPLSRDIETYVKQTEAEYGDKRDKLYLFGTPHGEQKIGVSKHPRNRAGKLAAQMPYELKIISYVPIDDSISAFTVERKLHKYYAPKNVRGEWFKGVDAYDFELMIGVFIQEMSVENKSQKH